MSSFFGHSVAAIGIYFCSDRQRQLKKTQIFWFLWLIFIACFPDIDYAIRALRINGNIRITHSFAVSLILPVLTSILLVFFGIKNIKLKTSITQLFLAGISHLILDLSVGVTPLPLFYPFSLKLFRFPIGILPSAGRIDIFNFFVYRNLFIELGVLFPLISSIYLISKRSSDTLKQKIQITT
ncbi:MAG: metal-dependent hydrolase, partial [Xenococcaceae cyanobacterium]